MNNIVGQPVAGSDFFDREAELARNWSSLQEGNHVLLLAPRRVGKTSLAYRIGDEAIRSGWKFVMVDVQKDRDELSFLGNLTENLKSAGIKVPLLARVAEAVVWIRHNLRGKIEGGGFGVQLDGGDSKETTTLENLVDRFFLELQESNERALIAVDELPVFLTELERQKEDGPARLRAFLNWFRALRLRYSKNVRWLLLGSVGLDTFVETRRLNPTINDLQTVSLGAYSNDTAVQFLQELGKAKKIQMPDEICRKVLEEIGWPLPFFLQLVFQRLHEKLDSSQRLPTPADVKSACQELVSPEFYSRFESWRGRLADSLAPDQYKASISVLNALCAKPDGLPRSALLAAVIRRFPEHDPEEITRLLVTVLGQLERDGYLLRHDGAKPGSGRYAFRSFLLRRYWNVREVA